MARKDEKYEDVETAYKRLLPALTVYARRNLIEVDSAIDVVNDAFVKVLEWKKENPDKHVSYLMVRRKVLQACRSKNRQQRMVSIYDPAFSAYFRTERDG